MGERGLQSCTLQALLPQAGGGGTASNTPGLDVPPLSCCSSVGQVGGPPTPTPGMLRGGGRGTRPTSPCDSSDAGTIACGWGSAGQASACPIVPALPWGTAAGNGPLSPTGCPRAQSKGGSCAVLCCAGGVPGCRRGRCTPSARSKSTAEKVRLCVKGLQDHVRGKALSKDSLRVQKPPAQPMPCKTTAGPKAASQRSRDGGQGVLGVLWGGTAVPSAHCLARGQVQVRITASAPPLWQSPTAGKCCWSRRLQLEELTGGFAPSLFSELRFPPDPTALPTHGWEAQSRSGSVSSPNPPSKTIRDLAQLSHRSAPAGFALTAPSLWVQTHPKSGP